MIIHRIALAQKTLGIIKSGHYDYKNQTVAVSDAIRRSVEATFSIAPDDWDSILEKAQTMNRPPQDMLVTLKNCTTLAALLEASEGTKVGLLNFASAKNPGGGFLTGAQAQEESLARTSALYATLTKDMAMYQYNRQQTSYLYSDYMIYSPDVPFWMDDQGQPLERPVFADVITSPAPNLGAMLQNKRLSEIPLIASVLKSRIEKVLAIAQLQAVDTLVLGAWGCGVFRNDPDMVAQLFKTVIESKYKNAFEKIVFAVLDTSKAQPIYTAFQRHFGSSATL